MHLARQFGVVVCKRPEIGFREAARVLRQPHGDRGREEEEAGAHEKHI